MQLLLDLDAFFLEHRCCGDLEAEVEEPDAESCRVWMACSCGGHIQRIVDPRSEPAE